MTLERVAGRREPVFEWLTGPPPPRAVVLLGAFDPVTVAHAQILSAASARYGAPGAWCMTTVLLDRPDDVLVPPERRLEMLRGAASASGFGVAVANRGTYVDVSSAASAAGVDAVFVVGSDKLAQLQDPRFYDDGADGVERTFSTVRFAVVERGAPVERGDVDVLRVRFTPPDVAALSATDVRRRVRAGLEIGHLVPRGVARGLRGYTDRTEPP